MKTHALQLGLLLASLLASFSQGAELVLRERATQSGSIIRLGDVADIGASSSAELSELASTPLLPAPAPGTQQYLSGAQIRDLLAARGVRLGRLNIQGAELVEIGSGAKFVPREVQLRTPVPRSKQVNQLTLSEAELRIQQAIEQHLQESSNERWRVEVSLNERFLSKVQQLGNQFSASARQKLRAGQLRFLITNGANERGLTVYAKLTQIQSVVVARQRIDRDQIVRAADVEIVEREGNVSSKALTDVNAVIGKTAVRTLRADEIVQADHVRAPWQVRRGETLQVFVRTGGIVVRTTAVAKENGAHGQLISVETLDDRRRLEVSVSGPGQATVHATGGQTTDYASLNRQTEQETTRR